MKVAVLGATGAVGRTMLAILEERGFPVDELVPLASERSAGQRLRWRGREWTIQEPRAGAFRGCQVALFSAGGARSREWGPVAAGEGAVVVDNSSAWRMDPDVPLVVPEVNAAAAERRPRGIIANPNCSTIQTVLPLEALRRVAGLASVSVSTYQSVSGAGQKGVDALAAERAGHTAQASPFPAPIDGNVIPFVGPSSDGGWTEEEDKMRNETRKILGLGTLAVAATCVRVPVEVGHGVAVTAEMERPLSVEEARDALAAMAGVEVDAAPHGPLPRDVAGRDVVRVGRIRRHRDLPNVMLFWVVGDNLRKGAATNAVQIAEGLRGG
ncbi:MAG TPA: aspartate-semialdehyde dehydrogenase [Longimicrobiales bacterium]|nr:aspartate-semialdehyde dehydrogenase [Longimicrobiales bacterium]